MPAIGTTELRGVPEIDVERRERQARRAADRRERDGAVADAVAVRVFLQRIGHRRTVVANIAHAVAVSVRLPGIRHRRTVIAHV